MPRVRRAIILALLGLDVAALLAAGIVASRLVPFNIMSADRAASLLLLVAAIPVAICVFALNRLYVLDELLEGPLEYGRIIYGCTLTAFGLSALGFWSRDVDAIAPSRRLVTILWFLSCVAVVACRFSVRRVVRALRRRGHLTNRVLIVGLGSPGLFLGRHFQATKHAGKKVVGFIDDFLPAGTPVADGLKVLGPPSALGAILKQTGADEIVVAPTAMAWESFEDLIRNSASLNGHAVRLTPGFGDILPATLRVHQFGLMPLLTIDKARITGLDAILKGVLDYGLAIALLAIALPALAVSALLLRATGVRAFRRVDVLGRGGHDFQMITLNTSEPGNVIQRAAVRVGLDEVTQLVNVLRGQMSIVGPRPVPVVRRARYERWVPNLVSVKPGITGAWAVRGSHASLDDEMRTTLFYIRNYAIWLDLEFIVRSVIRVLMGRLPVESETKVAPHDPVAVHR
jgi:lipopolysaccharide/colanic/teichoic acid biosynthesis glycosyltransferase